jgi:hypothetical protein
MKKLAFAKLIVVSVLLLNSCSTPSYFVPAIAANDVSYLPKPMGSDSVKTKNYLSASIAGLSLPYGSGDLTMGMVNYSRAHTTKNLTIAYGAFAFAGNAINNVAQNEYNPVPQFDKGFIGGGLRTSVGYYQRSGNAEFRILSWENALSFEGGGYSELRKQLQDLNDINIISSTKTTVYTTGLATEIIWHPKRNFNNHYAFRLFYGVTPGLNNSLATPYYTHVKGGAFDFAFYFKLNKLYGIINSGTNVGASSKLSLGYSF